MLVDDHEVVRLGLVTLLAGKDNFEVVAQAGSVKEAIGEAARVCPDVVLMDLRLPDGSGLDACRAILSDRPATRVLFLTSYTDEEAVVSSVLAGAAGYLLKEVGSKALINAIELVHDGQSILDPKITTAVRDRMLALANPPKKRANVGELSPQERRILVLVVEGKTNKEIASELGLSDKTVKNYLSNAFQKLNVHRRSHAAAAFNRGANRKD